MSRLYRLCVEDEQGRLLLSSLVLAAGLLCIAAREPLLAGLTFTVYSLERVLAVAAYAIEHRRARLMDQLASDERNTEKSAQALELVKKVSELETKVRRLEREQDDPMARMVRK
jgi:hypothetical protein